MLRKIISKITFKIVFDAIAAGSIVFTIIWSIQVQQKQDNWQRKVETLHALEQRDRSHMKIINSKIKVIDNNDSFISIVMSDSTLKSEIQKQLTIYEDISIGANIGVYDDEVIKRFIGNSFVNFNKKMQPYILYIRDKNKNIKLYDEYNLCAARIGDITN